MNICGVDTKMQAVSVDPVDSFNWRSLNWDAFNHSVESSNAPVLHPNDTLQVAFLLESKVSTKDQPPNSTDEKTTLGQLNIQWRSAMGDRGSLKTSMLSGRKR